MLLTHPNNFKDQKHLVRVWRNEFTRVMCDRLINEHDIELMKEYISDEITKNFPIVPALNLSIPKLAGCKRSLNVYSRQVVNFLMFF